jgi:hypothetical protein
MPRNDRKFAERLGATVILTASRSRRLEFLLKVVEGPVSSPRSLKVLCQQPRGPGLVVHRAASPARDRITPLGCVPPTIAQSLIAQKPWHLPWSPGSHGYDVEKNAMARQCTCKNCNSVKSHQPYTALSRMIVQMPRTAKGCLLSSRNMF